MKIKLFCLFTYGMVSGIYLCLALTTGTVKWLMLLVMAIWIGNGILVSKNILLARDREIIEAKRSMIDKRQYPIRFS